MPSAEVDLGPWTHAVLVYLPQAILDLGLSKAEWTVTWRPYPTSIDLPLEYSGETLVDDLIDIPLRFEGVEVWRYPKGRRAVSIEVFSETKSATTERTLVMTIDGIWNPPDSPPDTAAAVVDLRGQDSPINVSYTYSVPRRGRPSMPVRHGDTVTFTSTQTGFFRTGPWGLPGTLRAAYAAWVRGEDADWSKRLPLKVSADGKTARVTIPSSLTQPRGLTGTRIELNWFAPPGPRSHDLSYTVDAWAKLRSS